MTTENYPPVGRIEDTPLLLIQPNRLAALISEQAVIMHPSDRIGPVKFPPESRLEVAGERIYPLLGDSSGKADKTASRASG